MAAALPAVFPTRTLNQIMGKVAEMNDLKAQFEAETGAPFLPAVAPRDAKKGKKGSGAEARGGAGGGGGGGGAGVAAATADAAVAVAVDPAAAAKLAAKFEVLRSIGEECVTEADLRTLLGKKPDSFRLYDGFEPSGRMHIAQGIFKALNVNKCTQAGGTFVFWVADWFALMNDKVVGGWLANERKSDTQKGRGLGSPVLEYRWFLLCRHTLEGRKGVEVECEGGWGGLMGCQRIVERWTTFKKSDNNNNNNNKVHGGFVSRVLFFICHQQMGGDLAKIKDVGQYFVEVVDE